MILDETGKVVTRINMDDWGNVNKYRVGSQTEINYTGKKMDTVTGLYYFNQRYYDPEIGRFIQEDLAREYLNPYVYVGNNVANLVDPDGLTTFAELNGCSGCGGTSVRRGFDFNDPSYIGGGDGGSISMENGGGFPSISFGSSSIVINRANARPLPTVVLAPMSAGEKGAAINNLAAIISSARSGMVDAGMKMVGDGLQSLGLMAQSVPDPVYDVANVALGVGEVAAYGTGVGAAPLSAANIIINSGSLYKTYKNEGFSRNFKIQTALAAAGPIAGRFGKGAGLVVGGVSNRASVIYGNLNR